MRGWVVSVENIQMESTKSSKMKVFKGNNAPLCIFVCLFFAAVANGVSSLNNLFLLEFFYRNFFFAKFWN